MATRDDIENAIARARVQLIERFRDHPNDFFTEADLAAFLVHRLHVELDKIGLDRALAHLEYPTPFRCDMRDGGFCAKTEEDRTPKGKRYQRGHFDVIVFNPAYVKECGESYRLLKGQRWDVLRAHLEDRNAQSEPVAICIFELMYLRDPFWGNGQRERGKATMTAVIKYLSQDCSKLQHALKPSSRGFLFASDGAMLLFDNGLAHPAASDLSRRVEALRARIGISIEVHSTALRDRPAAGP